MGRLKTGFFTKMQPIMVCIAVSFAHVDVFGANVIEGGPSDINTNEYSGYYKNDTEYAGAATDRYLGLRYATDNTEFELIPEFDVAVYTCKSGYYLPRGLSDCEKCSSGNYCVGGEFAYNTDQDQGIDTCPNDLKSVSGAKSADECGKVLHIGGDIMYLILAKQSQPALAVRVDDKTYYAKMSPAEMGVKFINENATRSLNAFYSGVKYYIHDNSVSDE